MPSRYFNIMPGEDKDAPSVINTHQSVITFAGAPAVVTIVVKVLGAAIPPLAESKLLLLCLSLVVGLLIYWNTAPTRQTRKDKVIRVFFALINSFAIAAAWGSIQPPNAHLTYFLFARRRSCLSTAAVETRDLQEPRASTSTSSSLNVCSPEKYWEFAAR